MNSAMLWGGLGVQEEEEKREDERMNSAMLLLFLFLTNVTNKDEL